MSGEGTRTGRSWGVCERAGGEHRGPEASVVRCKGRRGRRQTSAQRPASMSPTAVFPARAARPRPSARLRISNPTPPRDAPQGSLHPASRASDQIPLLVLRSIRLVNLRVTSPDLPPFSGDLGRHPQPFYCSRGSTVIARRPGDTEPRTAGTNARKRLSHGRQRGNVTAAAGHAECFKRQASTRHTQPQLPRQAHQRS